MSGLFFAMMYNSGKAKSLAILTKYSGKSTAEKRIDC